MRLCLQEIILWLKSHRDPLHLVVFLFGEACLMFSTILILVPEVIQMPERKLSFWVLSGHAECKYYYVWVHGCISLNHTISHIHTVYGKMLCVFQCVCMLMHVSVPDLKLSAKINWKMQISATRCLCSTFVSFLSSNSLSDRWCFSSACPLHFSLSPATAH